MVQEQQKLQAHIESEGNNLKQNLEEFEDRVMNILDWKVWYRRNTALAIGGAAASGVLLAFLLPKPESVEEEAPPEIDDLDQMSSMETGQAPPTRTERRSRLHNVLDNSMAAILGVAADQVQTFLSRAIPGFGEHYREAERKRS